MTEKKLETDHPLDEQMQAMVEAMERGNCPINDETLGFFYRFLCDVRSQQVILDLILSGLIHVSGFEGHDPVLVIDDEASAYIHLHYPWIQMEAPGDREVH